MPKKELSYKEAMEELQKIMALLDNDEIEVDEMSAHIKRAAELFKFCKEKLKKTKEEIDQTLKQLDDIK
ncbi:MAG: exodeoxyribonuclease VII small subunit [Bacteroidales bacterium]|nr:exodeoxyribonuclease VII small subunit [Bacteroidales bacterium]